MEIELHLYAYCKTNCDGKVERLDIYKAMRNYQELTPNFTTMVYSYKAKRYVIAAFYLRSHSGDSMNFTPDRKMLRYALRAKGLDIR